jgi:hypothetical protein
MTKTYADLHADFISEQQNKLRTRGLTEQSALNEAAAIMKHFHGEDGDHDGDPSKARANHEKIMSHLHSAIGPKHSVYKSVASDLKKAQRHHDAADRHYDNPDKHMDHKDKAHDYENYAKQTYADHLKSSK